MSDFSVDDLFGLIDDVFPGDPGIFVAQKGIVHRSDLETPCPRIDTSKEVKKVEIKTMMREKSVMICPQCLMSLVL